MFLSQSLCFEDGVLNVDFEKGVQRATCGLWLKIEMWLGSFSASGTLLRATATATSGNAQLPVA